jgi:uncharacterized protein (DUF433 family)
MESSDLLARPVYGTAQVDRVLGLHPGTAERWIDGYTRGGRTYPPVVRVESTGDDKVTWGEFSETRLLAEFRSAGVPMVRMRPAVERLRDELDSLYPLALARPWIDPQGRELVRRVQQDVGLDKALLLVVIRNDQLVLSLPAEQYVDSAEFEGGVVRRIRPIPRLEHVVFDPLKQFGEPVVRAVPTAIIAEQYRAGDRIPMIAEAYLLTEEQVEQALRYELERGGQAPSAA